MSNSKDMPPVETMDYNNFYRVTPLFKNDLEKVLAEYSDKEKYINAIKDRDIVPIAVLNEFIRSLAGIPYKVIMPLMTVINNKENFVKYFEPLKVQAKK